MINKLIPAAIALSFAAIQPAVAATTITSGTPIIVVDGGETTSTITVAGLGTITGLTLTLNGLTHTYPDDLVIGLVNETEGLGLVFFSGIGGSTDISGVDVTFSDAASGMAPESFVGGPLASGTYLVSNYGQYEFTFFTNTTSFSGFNGLSANGNWTLYVDDVFPADGGSIANGWSLTFETAAAVPEPGTWAMLILGFGAAGAGMRFRRAKEMRAAIA